MDNSSYYIGYQTLPLLLAVEKCAKMGPDVRLFEPRNWNYESEKQHIPKLSEKMDMEAFWIGINNFCDESV